MPFKILREKYLLKALSYFKVQKSQLIVRYQHLFETKILKRLFFILFWMSIIKWQAKEDTEEKIEYFLKNFRKNQI